jgi:hypothetical protein
MDKDQAIREVHEIKQVIEESRKQSNRRQYWIVPALAIAAIIVSALMPPLAPVIGVGFVVAGVIIRRRAIDPIMKAIGLGVLVIGIVMILMTVLVVAGLMVFNIASVTRGPATVVPVPTYSP